MPKSAFYETLTRLGNRKKTEEATELVIAYGFWHKETFAQYYFPHLCRFPFAPHHYRMFNAVSPRSRGVQHAIAAPRGSGKTTTHGIGILHHICYKEYSLALGLEPMDFIVVIGETEGAYDVCDNVRAELETNQLLIQDFGKLVGETWGQRRARTKNDCYLLPRSRHSRIRGLNDRGRRPKLVLLTDIGKSRDANSPIIREGDWNWFASDVRRLEGNEHETQGQMNMLIEGTILHEQAVLNRCINNPAWDGEKFPAIKSWADRQDLWGKWKSLYTDLTDPNRKETARKFYEDNKQQMLQGVKLLWPDGLSYYRCQEMIISEGRYAFEKEMQQNPQDPEKLIFDMESAQKFTINPTGLERDDGRLVTWESLTGVSIFLDWMGGKDSIKNCFAAVVAVAWESFGHTHEMCGYVLDAWLERKPVSQQVAKCFDFFDKYSQLHVQIGIEAATINKRVDKELQFAFDAEKKKRKAANQPWDVRSRPIHQTQEKLDRISKLEPKITNGWLAFNRWLPEEFNDQMRLFPTHEFLDGPDALEGAVQMAIRTKPAVRHEPEFHEPEGYEFRF